MTSIQWISTLQFVVFFLGCGGLVWIGTRLGQQTVAAQAAFWLELRTMFTRHDVVHHNLRSGGAWTKGNAGPRLHEEWAAVDAYLELFEYCEQLIVAGLMDPDFFAKTYAYRVRNLNENPSIAKAKLFAEHDDWPGFLRLMKRLKIEVPPQW